MLRLSNDLGAFQTSLGIEQHADLKKVLVDLRADLVDVPLEVLRGFEAIAAKLHEQLGCMREEARVAAAGRVAISSAGAALVEERIAAAVQASLEQAGVVQKSNKGMSAQVRGICWQWGAGCMYGDWQGLVGAPLSIAAASRRFCGLECGELRMGSVEVWGSCKRSGNEIGRRAREGYLRDNSLAIVVA